MQDPIALLQSLTLPAGATTGQRIELDGTTGEIRFYSAAGNLVLQLDGAAQLRFFQDIAGGGLVGAHQVDDLLMLDPGAIANTFEVLPTGSGVDAQLWGRTLPRGVMAYTDLTTNDAAARAAGVNTDLAATFTADATRLYKVSLKSQFTVGTAAGVYALELVEGGTVGANDGTGIDRFERWTAADTPVGSTVLHANASVLYQPAAGAQTVRVANDGGSAGTVQLTGGAAIRRQLIVEDIGAR